MGDLSQLSASRLFRRVSRVESPSKRDRYNIRVWLPLLLRGNTHSRCGVCFCSSVGCAQACECAFCLSSSSSAYYITTTTACRLQQNRRRRRQHALSRRGSDVLSWRRLLHRYDLHKEGRRRMFCPRRERVRPRRRRSLTNHVAPSLTH